MKFHLKISAAGGAKRPVEGRKPGRGTLTSPANRNAARGACSASRADENTYHFSRPQGKAETVWVLQLTEVSPLARHSDRPDEPDKRDKP